jgi:NAD(P)-dependent dehydrogenase (short-subunit alcohol dehydrogenase family)
MDPNRLKGKNILITGAARGMGAANAEAFAAAGRQCLPRRSGSRRSSESRRPHQRGRQRQGGCREDGRHEARGQRGSGGRTVEAFGSINVGLFNAGLNKPRFFMDIDEDNWDMIMNVNTKAMWLGMQETARQMIAQGPMDDHPTR